MTFQVAGETPRRDYDFSTKSEDSNGDEMVAEGSPAMPNYSDDPFAPPAGLPGDWQDVGYTNPEQIQIYSGQSPDPVRTYQEQPDNPDVVVDEEHQGDPVLVSAEAVDDWDSIVTTNKHDVEPEETSAETSETEPSQDPEEAPAEVKPKVNRRRRRCKSCGELIEPDEVEKHAATHVEA